MHNPIVSGTIYALHNGDHNYRYIGLTTKTPDERLKGHIDTAKYNPKKNPHKSRWILKHEGSVFIQVLEYYSDIPLKDLHKREMVCIAKAKIEGWDLLNATDGGEGTSGLKISEEAKAASSARQLGVKRGPQSQETRDKIRIASTGRKHTEETRARLSEMRKGRILSEETKAKIAESSKGKLHTDEARDKISKARTGMSFTEEHRANIGKASLGRPVSSETRKLMSEQRKGVPFSEDRKENMARAQHKRWHTDMGKTKDGCRFCI